MTWLHQRIHQFFGCQENRIQENRIDVNRLRAHLEGENTAHEREQIETLLRDSPSLRAQAQSLEARLTDLRTLPAINPPAGLWEKIEQRLDDQEATAAPISTQPESIWFRWRPVWLEEPTQRLSWASASVCALLLAAAVWLSMPSSPNYHLIEVSSEPGFSMEADSYVVHHDLAGSPTAARQLVIAHYTDQPE